MTCHPPRGRYLDNHPVGYDDWSHDNNVIKAIEVRGKFMWWEFTNDWFMWCTYGMSGQWSTEFSKHSVLTLNISKPNDIHMLSFNDPRHFGTLKLVKSRDKLDEKLSTFGFDFIRKSQSTTAFWWFLRDCRKSSLNKPIGLVMLDQRIFCGVGNYLRAEILYSAKVSPYRLLKDVTYEEMNVICVETHKIMKNSYESGGATLHTFKDVEGNEGSFSSRFMVYGRKTDPWGAEVKNEKMSDGRTIWWAPQIQS